MFNRKLMWNLEAWVVTVAVSCQELSSPRGEAETIGWISDTHNVHCRCPINRLKIGESLADKAGMNKLQSCDLPTKMQNLLNSFPLQSIHVAFLIKQSYAGAFHIPASLPSCGHNCNYPAPKLRFILSQFSSTGPNWTSNLPPAKWSFVGQSALREILGGQLSASTTSGFHSYSCWQSWQKDWWICRHKTSINCPSWDTLAIKWHSESSHCCSPLFAPCCRGNLPLHSF